MIRTVISIRARIWLILLAAGCELWYALYLLRQFPFLRYYNINVDMGVITNHSHAGFVLFLVAFGVLFLLFTLAWWQAGRCSDRATLVLILGVGAVFALTLIFVYPVTAIDVFAYVDQSLVLVQYHQNPLVVSAAAFPHDPIMLRSDGWGTITAPYGPLGIVIDAIPTFIVGRNLAANVLLLKLMFSGMLLVEAWLAYRILRVVSPRHALAGALLVAWNPYLLFETCVNGHNDAAMALFLMLALYATVQKDAASGLVLMVASVMVKYSTAPLLPLLFVYGLTHQPSRRAQLQYVVTAGGASLLVVVILSLKFYGGADLLSGLRFQNERYLYSFSSVLVDLWPKNISPAAAATLGRVLYVPLYIWALWLSTRRVSDLLLGCYVALFFFLALGTTNFLYWYAVSAVVMAATIPGWPRISAMLLGSAAELAVALNVYVWVWIGVTPDNFRTLNDVSYVAMFLSGGLALLAVPVLRSLPSLREWRIARLRQA